MTEINHWLKWKEMCALALCPPDIQPPLHAFVHMRYLRYTAKYSSAFQTDENETSSFTAPETWHWFESYFQIHRNRQGKSYKDWLFARVSAGKSTPESSDIESGVSLLLRDVVRDRLRNERSPRRVLSLDANTCSSEEDRPISLVELLPDAFDTNNEVECREMAGIASSLADSAFESLSYREKLALFGRELGLSLTTPALLKAAGCGKTTLAETHRTALTAVAHHTTAAYPDESRTTQASLTVAVFSLIRIKIISWARAENRLSEFLNIITTCNSSEKDGRDGARPSKEYENCSLTEGHAPAHP